MPDSDVARQMTVTSGRKCYEQFARFSPLTSLVKTLLDSYQWYSPAVRLRWAAYRTYSEKVTAFTKPANSSSSKPSAKTSKVRATPSSRWLFRLVPSAHRIDATASGSSHDTMMLKTPCAFDAKDNLPPKQPKTSSTGTLAQEIVNGTAQRRDLLPTPLTQGLKTCQNGDSKPLKLSLLPTPMARDWKWRTNPGQVKPRSGCKYGETLPDNIHRLSQKEAPKTDGRTSQLNPLFVEEMMGFPIGWTLFPFLTPPQWRGGHPNHFARWRAEAIKAHGNSMVPQVVYEIFRAIDQEIKTILLCKE